MTPVAWVSVSINTTKKFLLQKQCTFCVTNGKYKSLVYFQFPCVSWWLANLYFWFAVDWIMGCPCKAQHRVFTTNPCSGWPINTLRPKQDGRHFADDMFTCSFFNENVWIPIKFSLKFVPKGPINDISALVQIIAWRRAGDMPLSEPMMVSLPRHICVTRL